MKQTQNMQCRSNSNVGSFAWGSQGRLPHTCFVIPQVFLFLYLNKLFLNMKRHYPYISILAVMSDGIRVSSKHTRTCFSNVFLCLQM